MNVTNLMSDVLNDLTVQSVSWNMFPVEPRREEG